LVERGRDQAHGLRRLFAPGRPRVIELVAGGAGVGRALVAVNLAVALAQSGRDTLLIDAFRHPEPPQALVGLGCDSDAALAAAPAAAIEIDAVEGLAVWPLELAERVSPPLPIPIPAQLPGRTRLADCVLVNNAATRPFAWTGEHEAHERLIVLSRGSASITAAYALVKRLSAQGMQRRFQVLVNRVASEAEARLIHRNIASVAQGHLDVRLDLAGFIPADAALARAAALRRSVLDLEPDAPSARAFRRLAESLARPARGLARAPLRAVPAQVAASL